MAYQGDYGPAEYRDSALLQLHRCGRPQWALNSKFVGGGIRARLVQVDPPATCIPAVGWWLPCMVAGWLALCAATAYLVALRLHTEVGEDGDDE